ncbi:MAG: hypothetical protein IRZ00_15000 [Gemmatimonadetes bacterium]|nr:hypothetical protein [Gemmatimonadota bacterium]
MPRPPGPPHLALAGLLAMAALPAASAAQQVRAAAAPDTTTIGGVVQAAVRFDLPAGYHAIVPDSLPLQGTAENAGRRQVREVERPDGSREVTVVYPVTPWRTGTMALPRIAIRLTGPQGERLLTVVLPAVTVRSVLPADTTGIQPKPPSDVLGPNRLLWPFVLAAILLLLLLLALAYWLWRRWRARRDRVVEVPAEVLSPRERTIREFDRIRGLRLVEMGESKAFYSLVTATLREYLAGLDPRWGTDLTTSELLAELRETAGWGPAHELTPLLGAADLVKFARRRPAADEALAEWAALRRWVETFPEPGAPAAAAPTPVPAEAA